MKNMFEIFKSPARIFFLLLAIGLLSFPFYLYQVDSIKNSILGFTGITSNNSYLNIVQIIEIAGWSCFIGAFSNYFWQIRSGEYKKFLPLAITYSSVIFIYTVCRQAKDAMLYGVIKAETISFAKILVIIFNAIYFSFYYTKLSRRVHYRNYLLIGMLPIMAYFLVFNFYLFGNMNIIPSDTTVISWINWATNSLPGFLTPAVKYMIHLFAHWPVTLYYILAEIFSACVVSTVFWKIANRFTHNEERGRFYPAIMITAQIAALLSGMFVQSACRMKSSEVAVGAYKIIGYAPVINKITIIIFALSLILIGTNWFFFSKVVQDDQDPGTTDNKKKEEVNIMDTIKKNPKYLFIALLTVYYGFCSVFMEQFWKDKIRSAYPGAVNYSNFISNYIILQSRISLIVAMFVSNILMRYTSWFIFAAVTPVLTIIGSAVLFLPFIFENKMMSMFSGFLSEGTTIGIAVCVIGSFVIAGFKAVKYGSFDPSKEEYIAQQDFDSRREIKNLEGATSKVGKAGGSVLLALLFGATDLTYGSTSVAVGLFVATMLMGVMWFITVSVISKDVKSS